MRLLRHSSGWSDRPHHAYERHIQIKIFGKIAGVCAGFAEYFDLDVTLVRVVWLVLLLIPPCLGLLSYLIAWIVMPEEPEMHPVPSGQQQVTNP